ncbi:hypothetical protein HDU82_000654 [Entophlyctis luteolus]|nr:hypothetical protein HDU82_000654 [Entophlyctis luteolus]
MIMTTWYTPGTRFGAFCIAAMFAYSAIFSSIFENSIPAGNDLAGLFPKYISIRTGFFICAVVSVLINPWYLLGSAIVFISFLASYQIFLSSITGVLLANYYLVARGCLKMPDLFSESKDGPYYFFHGFGLQAFVAYIVGIIPNFYGFLDNMGAVVAPDGVVKFYYVAYFVGLFLSAGTYYLLCRIWPVPVMFTDGWKEVDDFEEDPEPSKAEGEAKDA